MERQDRPFPALQPDFVGNKYDISPYRNTSNQKYIYAAVYLHNIETFIASLKNLRNN